MGFWKMTGAITVGTLLAAGILLGVQLTIMLVL